MVGYIEGLKGAQAAPYRLEKRVLAMGSKTIPSLLVTANVGSIFEDVRYFIIGSWVLHVGNRGNCP